MKIGIIGAGQIGGTLARRLTAAGHEVSIANSRGPASLSDLARETGAKPVTVEQAARAGDVVIVTIPMKNIPRLPKNLFDGVPDNVVVVDTGNYYPQQRDGRIDPIEQGATESRWVATQLRRPVVKAFNNIYARHLLERGKPRGDPDRIACRWPETTSGQRTLSSGCWISSASTEWTPADGRELAAATGDTGVRDRSRRSRGPRCPRRCQAGADSGVQGRRGGIRGTPIAGTSDVSRSSAASSGRVGCCR